MLKVLILFIVVLYHCSLHIDLRVVGNKILDNKNRNVILKGVNKSGTEFMCIQGRGIFDGPYGKDFIQTIKYWKANVVRVPLNEQCWLGINVKPEFGGINYQRNIKNYVDLMLN